MKVAFLAVIAVVLGLHASVILTNPISLPTTIDGFLALFESKVLQFIETSTNMVCDGFNRMDDMGQITGWPIHANASMQINCLNDTVIITCSGELTVAIIRLATLRIDCLNSKIQKEFVL